MMKRTASGPFHPTVAISPLQVAILARKLHLTHQQAMALAIIRAKWARHREAALASIKRQIAVVCARRREKATPNQQPTHCCGSKRRAASPAAMQQEGSNQKNAR